MQPRWLKFVPKQHQKGAMRTLEMRGPGPNDQPQDDDGRPRKMTKEERVARRKVKLLKDPQIQSFGFTEEIRNKVEPLLHDAEVGLAQFFPHHTPQGMRSPRWHPPHRDPSPPVFTGNAEKQEEMRRLRMRLPAWEKQAEVVASVTNNQVTVISGATGCGKTTQVPQFILDAVGPSANIICTQPRRISAIGVADRVASERCEVLGGTVGYHIRLESRRSAATRLLFCTTGILLRQLHGMPNLDGVTHVFVDEIHERSLESDFLLIILRDLLKRRQDLRVVLMSATLNAEEVSGYFNNCPIVHIPGFTFPVKQYYLENILSMTKYQPPPPKENKYENDFQRRKRTKEDRDLVAEEEELRQNLPYLPEGILRILLAMDPEEIDLELIAYLVEYICNTQLLGQAAEETASAILVFLPGWDDISKLHDILVNRQTRGRYRWNVLPLHSAMPTANQRKIFERPPRGTRKIVLATNIAETSITIDDVVYVIDSGKHKEKSYDAGQNVSCLLPAWVSQASARQRSGRAGRVQEGVCFHLYTSVTHKKMQEYQSPEILRTPLEELILSILNLQLGHPAEFLAKAMCPPTPESVSNALNLLIDIGAVVPDESTRRRSKHRRADDTTPIRVCAKSTGDVSYLLTPLGVMLARLPLHPQLGKMLITALLFRCLDPALTVAASLAHGRSPFVMPLGQQVEVDAARRAFADGSQSDHLMTLNVFSRWQRAQANGQENPFLNANFLSGSALNRIADMRDQVHRLLYEANLVPEQGSPAYKKFNQHSSDREMIMSAITAGLMPYLIRADRSKSRKPRSRLVTLTDGVVKCSPGSVNAMPAWYTQHWLVYHMKQRTAGGLFIYDCSPTSPLSIMLASPTLTVSTADPTLLQVQEHVAFRGVDPDDNAIALRYHNLMQRWLHGSLLLMMKQTSHPVYEKTSAAIVETAALLHTNGGVRFTPAVGVDEDEEDDDFVEEVAPAPATSEGPTAVLGGGSFQGRMFGNRSNIKMDDDDNDNRGGRGGGRGGGGRRGGRGGGRGGKGGPPPIGNAPIQYGVAGAEAIAPNLVLGSIVGEHAAQQCTTATITTTTTTASPKPYYTPYDYQQQQQLQDYATAPYAPAAAHQHGHAQPAQHTTWLAPNAFLFPPPPQHQHQHPYQPQQQYQQPTALFVPPPAHHHQPYHAQQQHQHYNTLFVPPTHNPMFPPSLFPRP